MNPLPTFVGKIFIQRRATQWNNKKYVPKVLFCDDNIQKSKLKNREEIDTFNPNLLAFFSMRFYGRGGIDYPILDKWNDK